MTQLTPVTGDSVVACENLFQFGTLCAPSSPTLRAVIIDTKIGSPETFSVLCDLKASNKLPAAIIVLTQDDEADVERFVATYDASVTASSMAHGETIRAAITRKLAVDERCLA